MKAMHPDPHSIYQTLSIVRNTLQSLQVPERGTWEHAHSALHPQGLAHQVLSTGATHPSRADPSAKGTDLQRSMPSGSLKGDSQEVEIQDERSGICLLYTSDAADE